MRLITTLAILLAATGAAAPVHAQPQAQTQPRLLEVPARSSWQHAQTEMILPPQVAGLTRGEIRDLGPSEMDVVAEYRGADGLFATVFLFRTAVPDTALWFDRAATTIAMRPEYGLAGAALPAPSPFARTGAAVPSGLRMAVDLAGNPLRSTGLAVVPLDGDHLLKIRISAQRLDRAGLDELLTRFVAGLRWPAPQAGESAAAPILPCREPLRLRNARILRSDMADVLMDAIAGSIRPEGTPETAIYCREPGATLQSGVYRPGNSRSSYLIALNDAGIALSLSQGISLGALTGEGRGPARVAMVLLDRSSTSVLPSFNRLPPPAQALRVAFSGRGPGISVSTEPARD